MNKILKKEAQSYRKTIHKQQPSIYISLLLIIFEFNKASIFICLSSVVSSSVKWRQVVGLKSWVWLPGSRHCMLFLLQQTNSLGQIQKLPGTAASTHSEYINQHSCCNAEWKYGRCLNSLSTGRPQSISSQHL